MADEPKLANEMQNTFQSWASHLLHHAGVDSDDEDVPWKPRGHWPEECDQSCACCRAHNFEDVECFWSGCRMCLDGWSLSKVNRHQRTLLREYVRSVQASASASSWPNNSSWRWTPDWQGSEWWRLRWPARRRLITSLWHGRWNWNAAYASDNDDEAWYYYDLVVENLGAQRAMRHTGYASHWRTWPWHQ